MQGKVGEVLVFFYVYFINYAITVVPIFLHLSPSAWYSLPSSNHSLQFMPMGRAYKFFGFSISYTILHLPLSIFYLPFMLLIPCTFPPILLFAFPADNLSRDLHFCESVPVQVVCLVFVCLGSVVDSCEFLVILLFIVFYLLFLS